MELLRLLQKREMTLNKDLRCVGRGTVLPGFKDLVCSGFLAAKALNSSR